MPNFANKTSATKQCSTITPKALRSVINRFTLALESDLGLTDKTYSKELAKDQLAPYVDVLDSENHKPCPWYQLKVEFDQNMPEIAFELALTLEKAPNVYPKTRLSLRCEQPISTTTAYSLNLPRTETNHSSSYP